MNVLLTSVGRRGYLVRYFKEALGKDGCVWGADNSRYAPAFCYCDQFAIIPEITHPDYLDHVLALCTKHKIDILVPLIDPELEVLDRFRGEFERRNIFLLLSPTETILNAADKQLTYLHATKQGIPIPKSYFTLEAVLDALQKGELEYPLIVKPRRGSASSMQTVCRDEIQLKAAFESCPLPVVQEYIRGVEYGYDLFADAQGRPISVYCKRKLAMRAGETDKAVSTNDPKLIEFGKHLINAFPIIGPADADVIVDAEGPKLLEINPRFGGGYPCSHLAGADFPRKILSLRNGQPLVCDIGSCPDGVCMLKQDEIIQPNWNGLAR